MASQSPSKKIVLNLARYNLWAHQQLLAAVSPIPDESYRANTGLVFRSIHGTLNHILLSDKVWYPRFTNNYENNDEVTQFWKLSSNEPVPKDAKYSHWETYIQNREELSNALQEQAQKWINHVASLPEAFDFSASITYPNTLGVYTTKNILLSYIHVFNHCTHHRGQISAGITSLGFRTPVMDLLYYVSSTEETQF
ncbi:hypothetical protein G9A89_012201 [Geosiphon pyriformis]|nr:hypothetical protein G9A89_012201 [Geosiphon pyriformis]